MELTQNQKNLFFASQVLKKAGHFELFKTELLNPLILVVKNKETNQVIHINATSDELTIISELRQGANIFDEINDRMGLNSKSVVSSYCCINYYEIFSAIGKTIEHKESENVTNQTKELIEALVLAMGI